MVVKKNISDLFKLIRKYKNKEELTTEQETNLIALYTLLNKKRKVKENES